MIDTELRRALDALSPAVAVEPRWHDVLQRAGRPRRAAPRRRSLLLAAAVMVAVPAIATAGVLVLRGGHPLTVSARIEQGRLTAGFSAHPSHSLRRPGSTRVVGFTRDVEWTLSLSGATGPVSARLVTPGTRPLRLCGPCSANTHGRAAERGRWWLKLLGGRTRLELAIDGRVVSARVHR